MQYKKHSHKTYGFYGILCIFGVFIIIISAFYISQFIPPSITLVQAYKKQQHIPYVAYKYLKEIQAYTEKIPDDTINFIALLKTHINTHPTDPYNTYYLKTIGLLYLQKNASLQASYYLNKAISKLSYNTKPIISIDILNTLIDIETNTTQKIIYLNMVLALFSEEINLVNTYYTLGTLYDSIADWDNAYKIYTQLLALPIDQLLLENQDHIEHVFFRVKKYRAKNTQTFDNVQQAQQTVLNSLYSRNARRIKSLQAPGFFTAQWQESPIDPNAHIPTFDIVSILRNSKLYVDPKFSEYSTGNKVLWATYGWERLNTWYMVFRKIQYPDTITHNGRWEWAGIHFGIGNQLYVPQ